MRIADAVCRVWRWMARTDSRMATKAALESAEAKLAVTVDDWRMVRDVLGDDVDRGLIGRRSDAS
jgi:hypothetical protein